VSAALVLLMAAAAPAEGCPARLAELGATLPREGFAVESPASPERLRAVYSEPAGRIVIEYRCEADGLAATIDNQGLPNIPFKVLLAAGPRATLISSPPERLRVRIDAVSN
jgi:hypothetical protein